MRCRRAYVCQFGAFVVYALSDALCWYRLFTLSNRGQDKAMFTTPIDLCQRFKTVSSWAAGSRQARGKCVRVSHMLSVGKLL